MKYLNLLFELGGDAHRFLKYLSAPFVAPLPWFLFTWPTNSPYKAVKYGKLSLSLPFALAFGCSFSSPGDQSQQQLPKICFRKGCGVVGQGSKEKKGLIMAWHTVLHYIDFIGKQNFWVR